tara:strand:- start:198 stop:533 length:336 start_codon:yes stop_codon:yes gene_type:complete
METGKSMGKDEIEAIKYKLLNLGSLHPGKISQQYTVCNKSNCACKSKINPKKHGPYYQLSYSVKGKSSTRFIKPEDIDKVQQYIDNYNEMKELLSDLSELYVNQFKSTGWH